MTRRAIQLGCVVVLATLLYAAISFGAPAAEMLLVPNSADRHVSFVDTARGVVARLDVGASPWGVALAGDGRAYVSTAEGVAVVDIRPRFRPALIRYRTFERSQDTAFQIDEYRPGGMGIAVSRWDGLSIVDVQPGLARETPVPDRPLDVVVLP